VCVYMFTYMHTEMTGVGIGLHIDTPRLRVCHMFTYLHILRLRVCTYITYIHTEITCVCIHLHICTLRFSVCVYI